MTDRPHRTTVFRLTQPVVPNIPLRVRSTGRCDVPQGWSEPPVQKWFVELTWILSGEGEALTSDGYKRLGSGDIHIYYPGETHNLRAVSKRWCYHWITLDHPDAPRWLAAFGLGSHQKGVRACPEAAFVAAADALKAASAEGERWAARRAHEILLAASAQTSAMEEAGTLASKAKRLMEENFTDPQFDLAEVTTRLEVHRSTLFRRFSAAFGIKPSSFLLTLRLQFGLNLLQKTNLSIQEVSLKSGFTDANYFARSIRNATGRTPSSFRNH